VGGIPVLLPDAEQHVALWRRQLGLLLEQGERTLAALMQSAREPRLAEATRARLTALGRAAKSQVDDVVSILGPALGGALAPDACGLPRGVVEYIGYLYRDWGWPAAGYDENEPALAELARLLDGRALGRTLVFGAGACGLAYELHLRHGASETVAIDIDPYLLVIGERIVRGESASLTEASLKWIDGSDVSRRWPLKAARGPLGAGVFHCVFADGVAPPFAAQSFDTVVTPWFIDQVPRDLPAFLRTLGELLRPGGRWLNQGPLVYPAHTPFERRHAREELFGLALAAGFTLGDWSRASHRYLVSPLTGNGKFESVLSFVASRS
jgi:SAM-dependent methyltransferase